MLGSALAFLVTFELLLRGSLPYLSLRYHKYLHGEIFILAQHSKRALLPHDYLAIFGDSYAEAAGDQYEDTVRQDWGDGLAYQAAHVIFRATGRDVIASARRAPAASRAWCVFRCACGPSSRRAAAVGVDFLDARPAIRAVARERLVHAFGDWKHFNRADYEALGRAIVAALAGDRGGDHCRIADEPVAAAGR